MTEKILDGICKAVSERFGIPVYTKRVVQGLDEPCFVVRLESSVTELFFGKRYLMKNRFKITYLDQSKAEHENSINIANGLCLALEVIDCGDVGKVRGSGFKCSVGEDMAEFWVNYDIFVYKADEEEDTELMWEMKIDTSKIRGGLLKNEVI